MTNGTGSARWTARLGAAFLAAALTSGAGCATLEKAFSEEGVLYKKNARANFEAGETAMEDRNWEEAVKYFKHVKNKFPYSKFAILAKLRIADAHFGDEKYLEAIEAYRSFTKLHPKHEKVPYANFSVAHCYYERMPEDWFFLPPVAEKDQTHTLDARNALQDYIARYPKDDSAPQAKELLAEVQARLVTHERYAAGFYARSGHWRAVAWRSLATAERFPESPEAPAALLQAGEAYEELGEGKAALRAYGRLQDKYPDSEAAAEARDRVTDGVENPEQDEQPLNLEGESGSDEKPKEG